MNLMIILVAIAAVVLIILSVFLIQSGKKTALDISEFIAVFPKENIQAISFQRNKIAVTFLNSDFFDPEKLQEIGAQGISIVGDTVKFYIEGTKEDNEALFQKLQEYIEGK